MRILVTVGTTPFDALIRTVDVLAQRFSHYDWLSQIGDGVYEPVHHSYIRFVPDLFAVYCDRFVVTHCGAGSVYCLLEKGMPFIAVPNTQRDDLHQRELAAYLKRNRLALVADSPRDLQRIFESGEAGTFAPNRYEKDGFAKASEIRRLIDR